MQNLQWYNADVDLYFNGYFTKETSNESHDTTRLTWNSVHLQIVNSIHSSMLDGRSAFELEPSVFVHNVHVTERLALF